ncbi:MAG: preprotein translocase subunit YajC [Deltaproteobacteria bacterium]|nr:preprotein translocase subunit YajC [Candidatus Anaeroferrophillus wilburensis]MBN2889860.1 preprotein translocase subunit YajC [Deltaproteobacteria bacterium]
MLGVAFAMAQNPAGGGPAGGLEGLKAFFPLILMFAIFYFLLIRPQQKKQKEHKNMLANLKRGDEIVTAGGLMGKVTAISDRVVTIEVADKIRVRILRSQVMTIVQGDLSS